MSCPVFWKTSNEDIAALYEKAEKAEKSVIAASPGGRPVFALGTMDPKCYSDPDTKTPALILIGTEHGQETEGTAAGT